MAPADPLSELRERVHAAQERHQRIELVPPELQQQVSEVIRNVLLLLRAVIDYWVDRLDAPRPAEVEVQDIPIS